MKGLSLDDTRKLEAFRFTLPYYRQYERKNLLAYRWDIVVAQFLLKQSSHTRGSLDVVDVAHRFHFHVSPDELRQRELESDYYTAFFGVTPEDAMNVRVDVKRPVLLAQIVTHSYSPMHLYMMDGYHRVYKAFHTGIAHLEMYTLTPQEERLCRY